jgi:hypothetical protein
LRPGERNVRVIKGRTDLTLEARRVGSSTAQTILLLEYKSPNSLKKTEWVQDLDTRSFGSPTGNAVEIGRQTMKYFCSTKHPLELIFDGRQVDDSMLAGQVKKSFGGR